MNAEEIELVKYLIVTINNQAALIARSQPILEDALNDTKVMDSRYADLKEQYKQVVTENRKHLEELTELRANIEGYKDTNKVLRDEIEKYKDEVKFLKENL